MKVSQTTKNTSETRERRARSTPKSQETRARVIRGAIQVLEECGIADATTRRIAAAADVQLAALHYHFESKESLLLAVLEVLNAELASAAFGDMTPGMPLETCVEALIRASWRHVARTRRAQIAQIELTLYALRSGEAGWLAARQYQSYVEVYASYLVGSIGRPDEEAAVLAAALARFILCGIDGLILQSFSLRDEALERAGLEALVEAARHHMRVLLAAG